MPNPNAAARAVPRIDTRKEEDPTSLLEQFGAAAQLDNVAVNAVREVFSDDTNLPFDPNFDPMEHLTDDEKLDPRAFAGANSLKEVARTRENLLRREEWQRKVEDGPLNPFVATLLATMADPTAYVPLVGSAAKGASFGRKLATGVLAGGVETATAEAALLNLQEGRTATEAAYGAAAGALFGGALAGAGAALGRSTPSAGDVKVAQEEFAAIATGMDAPEQGLSLGAAQVESPFTPLRNSAGEDVSELVGSKFVSKATKLLDRVPGMVAPGLRLATSKNSVARALASSLVDTGMVIKGNLQGLSKGIDLETAIKADGDRILIRMSDVVGNQFTAYQKRAKDPVNKALFLDRVGRALKDGTSHPDPEVDALAKWMRAHVFDGLANRAQKATSKDKALLPDDITPEQRNNYLTRIWKHDEISKNRKGFHMAVSRWLTEVHSPEQLADSGGRDHIADAIISNLLGHEKGRLPGQIKVGLRGPLKEKTFHIPDSYVEGFVENNAMEVAGRYIRTMVSDINTAERFGEVDPSETIASKIQEEADVAIFKVEDNPKEVERLQKLADQDKETAIALLNQVRGVTSTPADPRYDGLRNFGKAFRTLNFVRLLGGMTLSAVPDVARAVTISGAVPLIRAIGADAFTGFKGVRMGIQQAKLAGTAGDLMLASRSRSMFDIADEPAGDRISKGIDMLGQKMGTLTGMNHWNTGMKGITSMMVSSSVARAARTLAKGGELSTSVKSKLARSGLSEADLRAIGDEAEHFVDHVGGVSLLNVKDWGDQALGRKVEQALVKDVDNAIITPGKGDAPIWTNTEWGKTLFQFKRFAWAANQRVLIGGMQAGLGARDLSVLSSYVTMIALGAMAASLKDLARDQEVKDRTPEQWAVDAVNQSGLIALAMEADMTLDKASFGTVSAQRAITGDQSSRAAERNVFGQVFGPGFGFAEDAVSAVGNSFKGDFTQTDVHRMRKLLPYQNLFYIRSLLDRVEEGIAEAGGLEKVQRRKSRARNNTVDF